MDEKVVRGADGVSRCWWGVSSPDYVAYHDTEWGFPVDDEHRLFEKLCLEGFQSGLSWLTILRKRDGFRRAFHDFDYGVVAEMTDTDVDRLLTDAGIVRHRGKIVSTINNARRAIEVAGEMGSLGSLVWSFEPPDRPASLEPTSPESTALAKELEAPRVQLCRADHRPRLHAGHGHRQRPPRGVCHQTPGGRRPQRVLPSGLNECLRDWLADRPAWPISGPARTLPQGSWEVQRSGFA